MSKAEAEDRGYDDVGAFSDLSEACLRCLRLDGATGTTVGRGGWVLPRSEGNAVRVIPIGVSPSGRNPCPFAQAPDWTADRPDPARWCGTLNDVHASSGVFAPTHRALSVGILLSITAIACEGMAVATIMPSAALDLGGLDGYGWAFSAFMLASLVGAINAGQAADRSDACLPARVGFATFSVGLVVAGLASSWPVLLLARALQGFGAGCLSAIAYVAVARGYPERLRPRLLALLSSAWIMPALLGPALAGQVAEHASWRLVFIGILPPMAIGAWMLLPSLARLPEASGSSTDTRRVVASVRLAAGVALLLLGLGLPGLFAVVLVGALGLVLAAPALRVLLPAGTFGGRTGLPAAVAVRGLLAFGFFGSEALLPLGLSTQRGLPPSLVGLSLTAGALAWVLGSWVQDRAEARSAGALPDRAVRVAAGLLLIGLGIGGVAAGILTSNLPVELVVVAWGIGGLGMGLAYPASTLTALAPGQQDRQASLNELGQPGLAPFALGGRVDYH